MAFVSSCVVVLLVVTIGSSIIWVSSIIVFVSLWCVCLSRLLKFTVYLNAIKWESDVCKVYDVYKGSDDDESVFFLQDVLLLLNKEDDDNSYDIYSDSIVYIYM